MPQNLALRRDANKPLKNRQKGAKQITA